MSNENEVMVDVEAVDMTSPEFPEAEKINHFPTDGVKRGRKPQPVLIDDQEKETMLKFIDPITVERHLLVEEIFNEILLAEQEIKELKNRTMKKVKDYLKKTAEKYGENWQGNAALMNFKKTKQVALKNHKMIAFDERLNIAKQKIDHCLIEWCKNGTDEIRSIVTKAFQVDKKGNVSIQQILSLKDHKINHPQWKEAMEIIYEAITITGSKEYLSFTYRDDPRDKWEYLVLNFSAIE